MSPTTLLPAPPAPPAQVDPPPGDRLVVMHSHLCPTCRLVTIVTRTAPAVSRVCFTCADATKP